MILPYSGHCTCGSVRYHGTAQPSFSWICHCRDCQRTSGGASCPVLYGPQHSLQIEGEPRYHTLLAESGNKVSRGFCANCGSPLFILADLVPDLQGVWASSLDQPDDFEPVVQVWCGSARRWGTLHPQLPRIARAPDAEDFEKILALAAGS